MYYLCDHIYIYIYIYTSEPIFIGIILNEGKIEMDEMNDSFDTFQSKMA